MSAAERLRSPGHLAALLPVAVFAIALAALHRLGGEFHLADVLAEFSAIPPWHVIVAVALTAGSYLALTGYEHLALAYAGRTVPWRKAAMASFVSYAVGHNFGMGPLSGGTIRYRLYSPLGLGASDVARIVAFCSVTFGLGLGTLTGVSLIVDAGETASLLHSTRALSVALGVLALASIGSYVVACARVRTPLQWKGWSFELPRVDTAMGQILLSCADLLLAAGVLFTLLPDSANLSYIAFTGLFMVAVAVSMVSAVPGGLGVFESVLVLLTPGVPAPQMLGALLAYRLVYYALPFLLAVALLSMRELQLQRETIARALSWTRRSLDFVVPQVIALLVFGAGFLLLLSGATPAATSRLAVLDRFLPLPVMELSHLAGSAAGVLLLILARGLMRRLDAAWYVTLWLLGIGIAASLLKGIDYEEALLLGAVLLPLLWTRKQFYRKASLLAEPLAPAWLASAAIATGASIWVGLLAYRHVPYANELWWQFALDGHAPRMLRASLLAVLLLGAAAAWRLMTPVRAPASRPSADDLARARAIIETSPDSSANLALLGDKALLFSASGRAFLMYGTAHRSWVALGDPVGPLEEREEMVWRFRELADEAGAWSVFYQVSPEQLPVYVDAGLALSKLGEQARVRLDEFSLEGATRAALRQSHRRGQRDGLEFRIASAGEVAALLPELRRVSDDWLQTRAAAEKGFSLGRFDETYLRNFPIALVRHSGRLVAFTNLWETKLQEELSVDLMRHATDAPKSVMDFLFIELMLWGKAEGYRWFDLGMAPLAGLEQHRLAPAWHKVGRLVYRFGEDFYNFEGLRQYKEKFHPEWRPRYLAAPGGLALPRILLDVTSLISGGLVDTVHRSAPPRTPALPLAS